MVPKKRERELRAGAPKPGELSQGAETRVREIPLEVPMEEPH